MTASRISFLVFMCACVSVFCALGNWQIQRLHWKEGLIAQIDQAYATNPQTNHVGPDDIKMLAPDHFIRGQFFGRFRFDEALYLMGQIDDGKQTKHLMVPYIVDKTTTILVDMGPGFTPKGNKQPTARITGLLKHAPVPNKFTPDNVPSDKTWYSINVAQLNIPNLYPLVIVPETTPWKTYAAQKPELRNAHLQYAIFWFSMAGLISVLTACFLFRKL